MLRWTSQNRKYFGNEAKNICYCEIDFAEKYYIERLPLAHEPL